ncbi:MAG: CDP-alcohol phosphatidyltransferase family protein [Anaerolineaceae bacterium]|nr:CDP-alcohol phosphatidyltransferase family protein [Anaerolineaceae bacterium]
MTITDSLRKIFKNILISVSSFFLKVGLTPNFITLMGLFGNIGAALFISKGNFIVGGTIALLVGTFDAVDGTMARLEEQPSKFGSLFDSLIDRYSEMTLLLGILIYFSSVDNSFGIILVYLALCGSFLVSYIRARAEGLGVEVKIGVLTRVERLLVLVISLLFKQPLIGVLIIAVLGNLTAIQRLWFVRSFFKENK